MMLLFLLAAISAGVYGQNMNSGKWTEVMSKDISTNPPTVWHSVPVVQYFFIEIRATGKMEVELQPEQGVISDIDSLLVASRETKKNGAVIVTGKKYESYTSAFNSLASAGLEFVQMANVSTVGGATAALVGDLRTNYMIWKRVLKAP